MSSETLDLDTVYSQPPPAFGHGLLEYYILDPEYANLNNGSYGTTPKPVHEAAKALSDRIERNPDLWYRLSYQETLKETRVQLGELLGAHADELVLVTNATTGVNIVMRNLHWDKDDQIISFSTAYAAVASTINYLADVPPFPKKSYIPLTFPTTHASITEAFRAHLRSPEIQAGPNNKRVAVIDSLISNPGVLLPWKELVQICREECVISVVDAAHSAGQEVDINLSEAQPDFWVSNCHKWLSCKRSSAVLYVPFRNHHLVKTTLPTSNYYKPLAQRSADDHTAELQTQFEWTGTIDHAAYLTILDALKFRNWLGGEHKINEYCHKLAMDGGRLLADKWGTSLMDREGEYTLAMVNVELPIAGDLKLSRDASQYIERRLLAEEKAYSAWFYHNGKYWTRCSAQVFNDISDFERVGEAWLKVSAEVKEKFGEAASA